MATAYDVVLRAVSGTPSTVLLYPVNETAADRSAYDVYLYEVDSTPSTVVLRAVPGVAESSGGGTTWQGDASVSVAVSGSTKAMTEALPASIIVSPFVYSSDGMSVQTSASGMIIQIRDGSCAILPADPARPARKPVKLPATIGWHAAPVQVAVPPVPPVENSGPSRLAVPFIV